MPKTLNIVKIIAINILIFLFILVAIEGMVRYFHPEINAVGEDGSLIDHNKYGLTYGYLPNSEGYSFGSKIITDDNGFRINPKLSGDTSNKKILILGDSVGIGVGVDSENIFSSRISTKLNNINVVNASVTGYTFFDYLNILKKIINDDHIGLVLCLCLNDFDKVSQKNIVAKSNYNKDEDKKQRYPNSFVRILRNINDQYFNFNNFLRCHFMTYLWIKSLVTDSSRDHFLADMLRYHNYDNMSEIIRDQFAQLINIQKGLKLRLLIFIFPYEYQLRTGNQENLFPQEMIKKSTIDLGLDMVDLYSPMRKYILDNGVTSQNLFIFNDPCHFSSEGHKVIADIMLAELKKRGLQSIE